MAQQHVIDPSSIGQPTDHPIDIVPPPLRDFGAVPNFSLLKTGDLILSRGLEPDWVERSISGAQRRGGFSDDHSCWTHAAVFLYGTLVAEAVPEKGVRVRSLYDDVLQCVSRVRRPRATDEQGAHIALRGVAQLGTPYSVFAALQLGRHMRNGLWNPAALVSYGRKLICSKVYFDAHIEITKLPLSGCPMSGLVSPAHLSATDDLDDVLIPWVKPV
jgi:hypothetical protein